MVALPPSQIVPLRERFGYGLGEAGVTLIFQPVWMLQLGFLTGTAGLTQATAGRLFLAFGAAGALADPLIGIIADRTRSRFGCFRPWILWTALPFGLIACLAFMPLVSDPGEKFAVACAASLLLGLVSSASNLPFSALGGVMTGDWDQRARLSVYRCVAMLLAGGLVQGLALPLVNQFGRGNEARGTLLVVGLFSSVGVVSLLLAFLATRERVWPEWSEKTPLKRDLADLRGNEAWLPLALVTACLAAAWSLRGGETAAYFTSYLHRPDLFRAYELSGLGAALVGILLSRPFLRRYGRRSTLMIALLSTLPFLAALAFLPATALGGVFVLQALVGLAWGPALPLLWTMTGDVADFSEWKYRRRATGLVFAGVLLGLKIGMLFGAFLVRPAQAGGGSLGLRLAASVGPMLVVLAGAVCLVYYPLGNEKAREVEDDLAGRKVVSGLVVG